jgi:phosphonate transport system substrate-binding protein
MGFPAMFSVRECAGFKFQSYEAQVMALLAQPGDAAPRIDIAWNTNLAYLQADKWSGHACRAVAMRDTDLGWMTKIEFRL